MTDAEKLYATGLSLVAVAQHVGMDDRTLRREFEKACVEVRPRPGSHPVDDGTS